MNFREELKKRVNGLTATEAVDRLFESGALDNCTARVHVVVDEYKGRYAHSDESARKIQEDIAEEYGLSRMHVSRLVRGT